MVVEAISSDSQDPPAAGWVSRKAVRSFKATRRGTNVHIGLREHYFRDDIPCGSPACHHDCRGPSSLPSSASHYLIPDTSVIQHFWEILELPQLTAIIFLASILKEVRMQFSVRQWKRLRYIFTDKRRGNLYFDDEHFIHTTFLDGREGAGLGHTNVGRVAQWFDEHLGKCIPIIVLTDHVASRGGSDIDLMLQEFEESTKMTKDAGNNFKIMHVFDYVNSFWRQEGTILDLCSTLVQAHEEWKQSHHSQRNTPTSDDGSTIFKDHLSESAIEKGLQDGSLHVGVFHVRKTAQDGGFVTPSNKGEASKLEIRIPPGKFHNRALHGDLVVVRIITHTEKMTSEWVNDKLHPDDDLSKERLNEGLLDYRKLEDIEEFLEEDVRSISLHERTALTGEVVGILQRLQRDYAACLYETEDTSNSFMNKQEHVLCVPMDRRIPMVRVTTRQRSFLNAKRFVIRIDGWNIDSKLPRGHFARVLGPIGDLETENQAILVENEINILPYSIKALEELPIDTDKDPWCIPEKEYAYRRDLRTLHRTYSIDPPGSKDVDDCLSVRELDDNIIEIGVHIADVSYFVKDGGMLDLEAFSRGTTVYLVGNTYHMLPSVLSENLCSLREGKDRLAVSVIWKVDTQNEFEILDTWFGRTIIHSREQMFYAQAQAILDGKKLPDGWQIHGDISELMVIQSDLSLLADFSQACKFLRESKGALELVSAEMRFEIGESAEPLSVESKLQLPMNWIVAELMIQANSFVASRIYESFGGRALLRRHPPPKNENFSFMKECCEAQGLTLNASSNKALASSLNDMQKSAEPAIQNALKALATRAMSEAEYIAAVDASEPYGVSHYGLALEFYTHFTSPIRRYADIVVHRMLILCCNRMGACMSMDSEPTVYPMKTDMAQVATQLNERHRASKRAQKQCNELHLLIYLEKHAQAEQGVDKTGRVVLPAEDDMMINKEVDALQVQQQKHTLRYSGESISIVDLDTGILSHEYKRMTSVWVQMRADGSRAHFPTLQFHLLSDVHPAVKENISKNLKLSTEYTVPSKVKPWMKLPVHQVSRDKQPKRKHDHYLASMSTGPVSLESEIEQTTVHCLLEEFKLLQHSASSVYIGEDLGKYSDSIKEAILDISPANIATELSSLQLGAKVATLSSCSAINMEQSNVADVRHAWQNKLFQAALCQGKKTRSRRSNDSVEGHVTRLKEMEIRQQARSLYESISQIQGFPSSYSEISYC